MKQGAWTIYIYIYRYIYINIFCCCNFPVTVLLRVPRDWVSPVCGIFICSALLGIIFCISSIPIAVSGNWLAILCARSLTMWRLHQELQKHYREEEVLALHNNCFIISATTFGIHTARLDIFKVWYFINRPRVNQRLCYYKCLLGY